MKLLFIKYIIYEPQSLLNRPHPLDFFLKNSIKPVGENKNLRQEIYIKKLNFILKFQNSYLFYLCNFYILFKHSFSFFLAVSSYDHF